MRSTRLTIAVGIALACAIAPTAALGHAELLSSSPAADATLAIPPETVTLVFDGELAPDGTGFSVTGPSGVVGTGALDLTIAERDEVRGPVRISEPGTYAVTWTAVSVDGHEEAGDFVFSIAAEAATPNTASTASTDSLGSQLGVLLLAAAAGLVLRRVRSTV